MSSFTNYFTAISLCSSLILLTACGGSGSSTPAPVTAEKFTSEFSSSLTIQEENKTAQPVASRVTDETADVAAYSMETSVSSMPVSISNIENMSLSYTQKLVFQLDSNSGQKILTAYYDPIHKSFDEIEYTETINNDSGTSITFNYSCDFNDDTWFACQNINVQFNPASGNAELKFDNAKLRSSRDNSQLTINGAIIGKLSIAPQQLADIPKSTLDNIKINEQKSAVLAATYNPQLDINELLFEDGTHLLTLLSDSNQVTSTLFQPDASHVFKGKYYSLNNASLVTMQDQSINKVIQFNQAPYQVFSNNSSDQSTMVNGSVQVRKPAQTLKMSSWSKNRDFSQEFIPTRVNITLINHDEKILEANGLAVHLRNNRLYSIKYFDMFISPDSSTITQLVILDYQCGSHHSCNNITIESNGFGVRFNGTTLYDTTSSTGNVNSAITLNGGLIYTGR